MKSISFNSTQEALSVISDTQSSFVLFASPKKILELSEKVKSNVVLCAVAGEYTLKGYHDDAISGFSYDPQLATVVEINELPAMSKPALEAAYSKVKHNNNAFLLLLCNGLSGIEEQVMTTLYFMDEKFKVIGGSAGDDLSFTDTPIFIGNKRVSSVGLFFDVKSRTFLIKENIYKPMGYEMLVTDADPLNRVVKSFNGKPAATEYAKALGVSESELGKMFMNHPLGKIYGQEIYIASPQKINPDKSITFYCQIMPNSFVKILEPLPVKDIVNGTLAEIPFKPSFLFAINCILRSLKFKQEGLWTQVDQAIIGKCSNVTGFVSYGEQFYQRHINQTMVLLAVE